MTVSILFPSKCKIGESPMWHERRKSFFWVDIEMAILYEFNWVNHRTRFWKLDHRVSVVIENQDGDLILGLQGGIAKFNFTDGTIRWLAEVDKQISDNRCNDGACDSSGRIWVGSMNLHCHDMAGSLYCIDADLVPKKMIAGVTIPNGIAWSADDQRMYFIDSPSGSVSSYFFNKVKGEIFFERIVVEIPGNKGIPDGMAIDEQGKLWIALYGGFSVTRWDPQNGRFMQAIDLPVPNVTNCAFGGEHLDELVITTAREKLTRKQLNQYPQSGNVFLVKNLGKGIRGIKNYKAVHANIS
jgi:sugar lactone lactonase YvrE